MGLILVKLVSDVQAIFQKVYDSVSEDCGESFIRSSRSDVFCRIAVLFYFSVEELFLNIWQYSQESTYHEVLF